MSLGPQGDPAFPAMTLDFLSGVLGNAEDLGALGRSLTEGLRELTGAQVVVLLREQPASPPQCHPPRRAPWLAGEAAAALCARARAAAAPELWRAGAEPADAALLQAAGFSLSLAVPLRVGRAREGALLLLGVPDDAAIASVLALLDMLAPVVALVLRNAELYERQEQAIAARTAELERALADRERLLCEARLADRLRAVGTLAAGVAHEMNNPLSFVLANVGYALEELGEQGGAPPDVLAALQDARAGAARVRDIVRDLRTFAGEEARVEEATDLGGAIEASLSLAGSALKHRARLVTELEPLPPVAGSAHRLTQVFVNLLVNAAHAIPAGEAARHEVRIHASREGERAVVSVSDTGVGIAPELQPRIFDPFFTTRAVGDGVGLGLSVCHGIVTGLGGTIDVQSRPGAGSTFTVALPFAAAGAPGPARRAATPR